MVARPSLVRTAVGTCPWHKAGEGGHRGRRPFGGRSGLFGICRTCRRREHFGERWMGKEEPCLRGAGRRDVSQPHRAACFLCNCDLMLGLSPPSCYSRVSPGYLAAAGKSALSTNTDYETMKLGTLAQACFLQQKAVASRGRGSVP